MFSRSGIDLTVERLKRIGTDVAHVDAEAAGQLAKIAVLVSRILEKAAKKASMPRIPEDAEMPY